MRRLAYVEVTVRHLSWEESPEEPHGTFQTMPQMEHETRAIADISRTADAREGIAAFMEKRTASFEGN